MPSVYFDWQKFCDQHQIPYVTRGPNTARNHISVQCPWCGDEDEGQHMGMHLDPRDPKWGCFRDAEHRGRDPVYLVQQLLGCSMTAAKREVRAQKPETDAFMDTVTSLLQDKQEAVDNKKEHLSLLPEFRPLYDGRMGSEPFVNYLEDRGFWQTSKTHYPLYYARTGEYKWRVIIPLLHHGELVGWTGRHIGSGIPRYLTLPSPPALTQPDTYIIQQDLVERGGDTLVMVEGPIDFLKLIWFGCPAGIVVTAFFGMPKQGQTHLIGRLLRGFRAAVMMLDPEAQAQAFGHIAQMEELSGRSILRLSPAQFDAEDPGAMTRVQVHKFYRWLAKGGS